MKKETTKKRKRVSKAARQRQKLMITGGLAIILLILIIILAVFFFGSCGTDYAEADTNTVYVLKNGKIVSTDVEAFDEKTYDKDDLESYVKDVIDTYNKENGKNSLKQKSYEVEENVATLVLEYASADVYEDVNGVELFTGTISEAIEAGYQFTGTYAKLENGKVIESTAEFVNNADYKVVIIKSNTKVVVDGEIGYVSIENIADVGEDWVLIKDGAVLEMIELDTETLEGTEVEESDDAISEDELLTGEGEIIFDFGEEEEKGSQYSEVLTYIIYK